MSSSSSFPLLRDGSANGTAESALLPPPSRESRLQTLMSRKHELETRLAWLGGRAHAATANQAGHLAAGESKTMFLGSGEAHRDYLLKEMSWMSNDFRVERKWKMQSAKKLVRESERAFLKKDNDRKRDAELKRAALRKTAIKVARQVKKTFWDKIDRIVTFKNNVDYVAEQQIIMDKNLDRLLYQTERYTSSLIASATSIGKRKRRNRIDEDDLKKAADAEKHMLSNLISQYSDPQFFAPMERVASPKKKAMAKRPIMQKSQKETSSSEDLSWNESNGNSASSADEDIDDDLPDDDGDAAALEADLDVPIEQLMAARYGGADREEKSLAKKADTAEVKLSAKVDAAETASGEEDDSWQGSSSASEDIEDDKSDAAADEENDDAAALQKDLDIPIEELIARQYGGMKDAAVVDEGEAATTTTIEPPSKKARLVNDEEVSLHHSSEDKSWAAGSGESSSDDESVDDMDDPDDDGNANGLEEDLNMSLEEVLARRYGMGAAEALPAVRVREDERPSTTHLLLGDEYAAVGAMSTVDGMDDTVTEPDDASYSASPSESDDEETLVEAEKFKDEEMGADELQRDSERPLEEVLAEYARGAATTSSPREDEFGDSSADERGDDESSSSSSSSASSFPSAHTTTTTTTTSSQLVKHTPPPPSLDAGEEDLEDVPLPFLINAERPLREYQRAGLNWLVSLHDRQLNGILADEMGLGKTVQTISLLAHLAGTCGVWGPHLIVVPTSVILNWDVEFKTWCPAFKVMTYFGSSAERAAKRSGWTKPNAFHVCVTSYQLAVQDAAVFRRKKWYYIICDEAHALKNPKSQRWQTLLSFQAKRRLLITGTPLQNNLMELWSLMHFLMPAVFRSQHEFKHWFSNPLQAIVEDGDKKNASAVKRLHAVMRPFILRRLKRDVATQLPSKYEHIVRVPLARRQRFLYEDFISLGSTQNSLKSGGYLGMMSVLMKLRMVCNHPDLFEPRLVASAFVCEPLNVWYPRRVRLSDDESEVFTQDFQTLCSDREFASSSLLLGGSNNMNAGLPEWSLLRFQSGARRAAELLPTAFQLQNVVMQVAEEESIPARWEDIPSNAPESIKVMLSDAYERRCNDLLDEKRDVALYMLKANARRVLDSVPAFGMELVNAVQKAMDDNVFAPPPSFLLYDASLEKRLEALGPIVDRFVFVTPSVKGTVVVPRCFSEGDEYFNKTAQLIHRAVGTNPLVAKDEFNLHRVAIRQTLSFPDRFLIQYDCGKLQALATMLRRLKSGGHRVLIFTQMSRMLDVLERFLNLHSHTYFRLDGSTKVEDRQSMMDRFNRDRRVFCFILSTRSGGLGINLTGADTVIFYDSDWNPSMDAQAQDRAHRIGQTRDVHIYRLVSERTVEENILLKSNQKRHLNRLSVEDGQFSIMLGAATASPSAGNDSLLSSLVSQAQDFGNEEVLAQVEDESDLVAAKRAKEEEVEMQREDAGYAGAGGAGEDGEAATTTTAAAAPVEDELVGGGDDEEDAKIEDNQGNVLMTAAQYKELESKLRGVDTYGIEFRTKCFSLIDKLKESRRAKEAQKSQMVEEQTKDWEIDVLENERKAMEREAEEDAMVDAATKLGEAEAKAIFEFGRRSLRIEKKLLKITGKAWGLKADKGRPYYYNQDTMEQSWERPRILDAEEQRSRARRGGWVCLPESVLDRIARMVSSPVSCGFDRVCFAFWRVIHRNPKFCLWVDSEFSCKDEGEPMTIGKAVESRFKGENAWYAGTVVDSLNNGRLSVMYTDGDLEIDISRDFVKPDGGERFTLIHGDKPGVVFEIQNKTLASGFACGTLPLPARRFSSLKKALEVAQRGDEVVLAAGTHRLEESHLIVPPGVRIMSEAFWAKRLRLYDQAVDRVLPDYEPTTTGMLVEVNTPPNFIAENVDALHESRASVLATAAANSVVALSITSAQGRFQGLHFDSKLSLSGNTTNVHLVSCVLHDGLIVGDHALAAVEFSRFFSSNLDTPRVCFESQGRVSLNQCDLYGAAAGPAIDFANADLAETEVVDCDLRRLDGDAGAHNFQSGRPNVFQRNFVGVAETTDSPIQVGVVEELPLKGKRDMIVGKLQPRTMGTGGVVAVPDKIEAAAARKRASSAFSKKDDVGSVASTSTKGGGGSKKKRAKNVD